MIQVVRNSVASITNFSLTPIPFFVLMGEVLFHTGLAVKVIDGFDRAIRGVPARLSVVAIVAGTVFSAISGSTIATTALLGGLLLPEMLKRGYHPRLAMGPIMAIGGVDMLIPPSALTVLLGSLAGISISGLLIAGVVPGLLLALMFLGWIIAVAVRRPEMAPAFAREDSRPEAQGWARFRPLLVNVTPLVLIFVLVIVAMSAGWATPTESAALGALATVVVCFAYRALSWKALVQALQGTAAISGVILFIIIGATTFSQILAFSGATSGLVGTIKAAGLEPWMVMAGMILILLVLGCFVDQVSMMLITLPFFMPLVQRLGVDPIWFGILIVKLVEIAVITPPVGLNLFVASGITKAGLTEMSKAVMPWLYTMLVFLMLITYIPSISTFLPKALGMM